MLDCAELGEDFLAAQKSGENVRFLLVGVGLFGKENHSSAGVEENLVKGRVGFESGENRLEDEFGDGWRINETEEKEFETFGLVDEFFGQFF